MRRLTPYLFFLLAAAGLLMVAIKGDAGFEDEVDPLQAILVIGGVFIGAHALRHIMIRVLENRQEDD